METNKQLSKDLLDDLIENFSQGNLDYVQKRARKFALEFPQSSLLLNILGAVYTQNNQKKAAMECYVKAIKIDPRYAEAHNNLGNLYKNLGDLENAASAYEKAIEIKPRLYEALYNLGTIFQEIGRYDLAAEKYQDALNEKPNYLDALINLGDIYRQEGKYDESLKLLKNAHELNHSYAETKNNLALYFRDLGQLDKAIEYYNEAILLDPSYAEAYNNLGIVFRDKGDFPKAIENYNKAIKINPNLAQAHSNLSSVKKYKIPDPQLNLMNEVYEKKELNPKDRFLLAFALGKAYEDLGDYEKSFKFISKGNKEKKKIFNYSIDEDQQLFAQIKSNFKKLVKSDLTIQPQSIKFTPIFIVGMPRSGTTLVEQIISSHSRVYGAGELRACGQGALSLIKNEVGLNVQALQNFRNFYLHEVQKLSNGEPFVTDKMPANFKYIGIITRAIPEAKIIHTLRDSAAVCWSNYKRNFTSKNLAFSNDLKDITEYYKMYKDLMNFWETNCVGGIYNLNYEQLTTKQEKETRKLLEYLGLPWEHACITPENNKRTVRTASSNQVREKVYQGSSQDWSKYAQFLKGALDAI